MKTARTTAYALDWASAPHLPIVGATHPLRIRYNAFLYRSLSVALAVHLTVFTGFTVARILHRDPPLREHVVIITPEFMPMPPPIVTRPDTKPPLEQMIEITQAKFGIPVPVEPWKCGDLSLPSNDDLANLMPVWDPAGAGWKEGDSLVVSIPEGVGSADPDPAEFVAAEEMPVLINLPAPAYPEMARQAGMEGTVMVRALVGKDGKVQKAFVTESLPMLDDAAVASVRGAVFKPALQQHKPVAVWVQVPMRFSLQ
jgi:TonB family protein